MIGSNVAQLELLDENNRSVQCRSIFSILFFMHPYVATRMLITCGALTLCGGGGGHKADSAPTAPAAGLATPVVNLGIGAKQLSFSWIAVLAYNSDGRIKIGMSPHNTSRTTPRAAPVIVPIKMTIAIGGCCASAICAPPMVKSAKPIASAIRREVSGERRKRT